MTLRIIEDFECLYYKSLLPNSLGSVVIFHGYGADAQNLAPLRQIIDPRQEWNWYFPNGKFKISFTPSMEGRAWFPLNMMDMQMAYMAQKYDFFENQKPYGMFETVEKLKLFFAKILLETDTKNLNIGGFSQGSMVALFASLDASVFLHLKNLFLFSSSLVSTDELCTKMAKLPQDSRVNVLQSHGRADPVLPFSQALKLSQILKNQFNRYAFLDFHGGHEIPDSILQKSRQQLELDSK